MLANIFFQPTVQERGVGDCCLLDVVMPAGFGIKNDQNATIQVVTCGDPNANCAVIVFEN